MNPTIEAFQLSIEALLQPARVVPEQQDSLGSSSVPALSPKGRRSITGGIDLAASVAESTIPEGEGSLHEEKGPDDDQDIESLKDDESGTDADAGTDAEGESAQERAANAWGALRLPVPTTAEVCRFMELADAVSGLPPPWYWFEIPQLLMWPNHNLPAALINVAAREGSKSRRQLLRLESNQFAVLFPEQPASEGLMDVLRVSLSKLEKAQCWEHARGIARTLCDRHERVHPSGI